MSRFKSMSNIEIEETMMIEKYKIKTAKGYFGLGYEPESGMVIIHQGRGKAPSLSEVKAALAALPKIAPMIDLAHPWRIVRRDGMSGCRDYTLLSMYDTAFGFERRVASLHISMNGKLNQGYRGPLALLQLALEEEGPDEDKVVEILPLDEDKRVWNRARPVRLEDLRVALRGPEDEEFPEPRKEVYGED